MYFSVGVVTPVLRRLMVSVAAATLAAGCAGAPTPTQQAGPAPAGYSGGSGLGSYLAGRFAQSNSDPATAIGFYLRAIETDSDNVELLQRGFTALAVEGRFGEAAALARRIVAFDSEAPVATLLLAEREAKAGDFAAAERRVAGMPRRGLATFLAPLMIAWAQVGQGRTDQALQTIAPMKSTPSLLALHDFHAGLINDLANRGKAAEEAYRSALSAAGGLSIRAVQAVGSFYQRQGEAEKARGVYVRYREQHPDTALLDGARMLAAGAGLGRPIASAQGGMAEALFGAASSVRQNNMIDLSLALGRMALDLQPDFPLAQMLVADLLQSQGRIVEANQVYGGIDAGSEVHWTAQLKHAANLAELGRVDEATALLDRMAAEKPERIDSLVALGDLLRQRKRFADAALAYGRAIERLGKPERRHWALYYSRGIAYERIGEWDKAEADLLQALAFEPDQPYVLNYLGYSWVEKGARLDEARRMIETAAKLRPEDGYIVDSLGWVLFRLGDYVGAVARLERAIELRPEDPTINDHLGDALWQVGRRDEARFQWSRALSLEPEPESVAAIRAKLAAGLPALAARTGGR